MKITVLLFDEQKGEEQYCISNQSKSFSEYIAEQTLSQVINTMVFLIIFKEDVQERKRLEETQTQTNKMR